MNYKNKRTRISLLSDAEIEELYNFPRFTDQDREIFFSLSINDHELLNEYRTLKLKIYFILQLGYFKATKNFYDFKFSNVLDDVTYIIGKYFTKFKVPLINKPYRENIKSQQNIILKKYNYTAWSSDVAVKITRHLSELIRYYPKIPNSLRELFKYLETEV